MVTLSSSFQLDDLNRQIDIIFPGFESASIKRHSALITILYDLLARVGQNGYVVINYSTLIHRNKGLNLT